MRTQNIALNGIVRSTGEHNPVDGACDEVINMRLEGNVLKPVGVKTTVASGLSYKQVYEHKVNNSINLIGVTNNGVVQWFSTASGSTPSTIYTSSQGDVIDIKSINNLLIITSHTNSTIYTYVFENNAYSLLYDGVLPQISLHLTPSEYTGALTSLTLNGVKQKYSEMTSVTTTEFCEDIVGGLNYLRHKNNINYTEGFVGVCANYTLFDGSETMPTQPVWFYLGGQPIIEYINTGDCPIEILMLLNSISAYVSIEDSAYAYNKYKNLIKQVNIYCTYPKSGFDIEQTYKSKNQAVLDYYIKRWINNNGYALIYPQLEKMQVGINTQIDFTYQLTDRKDLSGELFYLQKSVPLQSNMQDMSRDSVTFDFSENMLTFKNMKVENSGYIKRFGESIVYNSRLHLFNTTNTLSIAGDHSTSNDVIFGNSWKCDPTANELSKISTALRTGCSLSGTSGDLCKLVIYTKVDGKDLKSVRMFQSLHLTDSTNSKIYVALNSFPTITDSRSYRADLYVKIGSSYYKYALSLGESKAYDYTSWDLVKASDGHYLNDFFKTSASVESGQLTAAKNILNAGFRYGVFLLTGKETTGTEWNSITSALEDTQYKEGDVVTVSAQNNPTFFDPKNSYRAGGNIVALGVNTSGISDVQIGEFPLAVFTDKGIYGLQVGNGEVLYSNVVSISDTVCKYNNVKQTKYGLVFLAGDGLYLLNGRNALRMSASLDGKPDYDIRFCPQYIAAHKGNNANLYNITNYLSAEDFREFIVAHQNNGFYDMSTIVLLVDTYRDELIVSRADKAYSYVYNFAAKSWHKISESFSFCSGRYAVVPVSSTYTMKNINEETFTDTTAHIQSRALKMGAEGFKSIYRTLCRVNVNNPNTSSTEIDTSNGNVFSMYLYASRDMKHWTMIGACQRTGYADLLQIAKTSGAYKYFVITLGGKLKKDNEVGYINADVMDKFNNKDR